MSPVFLTSRSKCAPACPGCTRRYRCEVLVSSAFSVLAIVLGVLAAVFVSRSLAIVGIAVLIPAWWYGRRALKALAEVQAAEETARRYGGRR